MSSKGEMETWLEDEKGNDFPLPSWQKSQKNFLLDKSPLRTGKWWYLITLDTVINEEWPNLKCHTEGAVFKPKKTVKQQLSLKRDF